MGLGLCSLLSYIRLPPYAVVLILSSTFPQPLAKLYTIYMVLVYWHIHQTYSAYLVNFIHLIYSAYYDTMYRGEGA